MSEGVVKKEERRKFQAIRGVRDLLPPETVIWNRVDQTAHDVFATYGFGEIRLPIFEPTELLVRAMGQDTDIVSKELYSVVQDDLTNLIQYREALLARSVSIGLLSELSTYERLVFRWLDEVSQKMAAGQLPNLPSNQQVSASVRTYLDEMNRAAKRFFNTQANSEEIAFQQYLHGVKNALRSFQLEDVSAGVEVKTSLRPEATASVCRAYLEHNMQQLPQPVKLYYMGPMFRRERPQKGRYRQFYQIGAEVLGGTDAPAIDAEVIEMVMTFFDKLGLQGVQLDINSIGCRNCRPKYVELLRAELTKVKNKLGPDSQRRIETNPLRVLDSKVESEQPIIAKLPRIADHLCEDCKAHYAAVKGELDLRAVKYHENWRLVRGLDYYMRTTFEITAPGLGSQNAVCGGGRYDGLVELLGGPPTKGIGFAIGEDRLILSLQESGKVHGQPARLGGPGRDVYIAWMGEKAYATAIRAAKDLRNAGFSVELPPVEQKFGKALGQADKIGAKYALILGDNEISSGEWTLKTLATGEQAKVPKDALLEHLRKS